MEDRWICSQAEALSGSGANCESWAPEVIVNPAKAGIHSANLREFTVEGLDSRFRGNDRRFEARPGPNDTSTRGQMGFTSTALLFRASHLSR